MALSHSRRILVSFICSKTSSKAWNSTLGKPRWCLGALVVKLLGSFQVTQEPLEFVGLHQDPTRGNAQPVHLLRRQDEGGWQCIEISALRPHPLRQGLIAVGAGKLPREKGNAFLVWLPARSPGRNSPKWLAILR